MKQRVAVLGVLALVLASPLLATAGSDRPRTLYASARGETVRATTGSYCVRADGRAVCADAIYPLEVRGKLLVSPPRLVVLRTHDMGIKSLRARLLRVEGDEIEQLRRVDAHRAASHAARWRAEMPRHLRGANRLDIFVRYQDGGGDANFWVKIAERD